MAKGYMPLFFDTLEETQDLTDEEFGRLIRAVGAYAIGEPDYMDKITGNEKYALRFLIGQIDRNNAISDARSRAGSNKKEQNETNGNKPEQNGTNSIKEKDKEKDKNKDNKKEIDALFEVFWKSYPRKEAKPVAKRSFEKLNPTEELLQTMLTAIEKWKQTDQWQENGGQYIPHPATWLNQKRWEDEPPVKSIPVKPVAAQQYNQRDYATDPDYLRWEEENQREIEERIAKMKGAAS